MKFTGNKMKAFRNAILLCTSSFFLGSCISPKAIYQSSSGANTFSFSKDNLYVDSFSENYAISGTGTASDPVIIEPREYAWGRKLFLNKGLDSSRSYELHCEGLDENEAIRNF